MNGNETGGEAAVTRWRPERAEVYPGVRRLLRFKRNDFPAASQIADAGYEAARVKLREWLASAPDDLRTRRPDLFASEAR